MSVRSQNILHNFKKNNTRSNSSVTPGMVYNMMTHDVFQEEAPRSALNACKRA